MHVKEQYLQQFRTRLNEFYYQQYKYNNRDIAIAQGVLAFIEAGITLGAVTRSELEAVIDERHMEVFGVSRQERLQNARGKFLEVEELAFFDTPFLIDVH